MATAASIPSSQEKADCLRLVALTTDGGISVLRHSFDQAIPPSMLQSKLNDPNFRGKLNQLRRKNVITRTQWDTLYPQAGQPSSADFDITLLSCLLRYTCGLDDNSQMWTCIPPSFDISTEADIRRLTLFRNQLCHLKSISVTKEEFENMWNDIKQALLRLGNGIPNLEENIQRLKEEDIDPETQKMLEEKMREMRNLEKIIQEDITELKREQQNCSKELTNVKETLCKQSNEMESIRIRHDTQIGAVMRTQAKTDSHIDRLSDDLQTVTEFESKLSKAEQDCQQQKELCAREHLDIQSMFSGIDIERWQDALLQIHEQCSIKDL